MATQPIPETHEPANPVPTYGQIIACFVFAGVGGTLPTLSRLAGSLVTSNQPSLPEAGFWLGVFLFFLIGGVIGFGLAERTLKHALIAGIAAPAIIMSYVNGSDEKSSTAAKSKPPVEKKVGTLEKTSQLTLPQAAGQSKSVGLSFLSPVSVAQAQGKQKPQSLEFTYAIRISAPSSLGFAFSAPVVLTDASGNKYPLKVPPLTSILVQTKAPVVKVELKSGIDQLLRFDETELPRINEHQKPSGVITLTLKVVLRKGLKWAFGGSATPEVAGDSVEFSEIRTTPASLQGDNLAGNWKCTANCTYSNPEGAQISKVGGLFLFKDDTGRQSLGTMNSPNELSALDWTGIKGTVRAGKIYWTDGKVWTRLE